MGFAITEPREESRQGKHTRREKTASGNFFAKPNRTRPANRRQPLKTRLGNPSTPTETASGVLYYGYRYYDPVTGRWPSRDPMGQAGGDNLYVLVENNPIRWTDYLGLIPNATERRRLEEQRKREKEGRENPKPLYPEAPDVKHPIGKIADEAGKKYIQKSYEEFIKELKEGGKKKAGGNPREYGGRVCCKLDKSLLGPQYYYTYIRGYTHMTSTDGSVPVRLSARCKKGYKTVAFWHTHPGSPYKDADGNDHFNRGPGFSDEDKDLSDGGETHDENGKAVGIDKTPSLPVTLTIESFPGSGKFETYIYINKKRYRVK